MYNQLWTKILDSSIWLEDDHVRLVWITFLAVMDKDGFVALSGIGNVALRARVTEEQAADAIERLSNPDDKNPDQEFEGRRIERVAGMGWDVLNSNKYKGFMKAEEVRAKNRKASAKYREKLKAEEDADVIPPSSDVIPRQKNVIPSDTDTDTDTSKNNTHTKAPSKADFGKPKSETELQPLDASLGFALAQLGKAFPELRLSPFQQDLISQTVQSNPTDTEAWKRTLQIYSGNHDPKRGQYRPEKVGTLLEVFEAQKKKVEKEKSGNDANQKSVRGRKSNAEKLKDCGDFIAQFPTEAELASLAGEGTGDGERPE